MWHQQTRSHDGCSLGNMHERGGVWICFFGIWHFDAEEDDFLWCIVTEDKYWAHYFQSETKWVSKEWRHSSSSKPKVFHTTLLARTFILMLDWDCKGPVLKHYMRRGTTVNSEAYCGMHENHLKPAISQNGMACLVVVCCYSMTCSLTQNMQQIKKLWICF